jgi:hypothetical protein
MNRRHMETPVPDTPRRCRHWGLRVLCFHMYEAPPEARGRPRSARFKAEALSSNIAKVFGHPLLHTLTFTVSHRPWPPFLPGELAWSVGLRDALGTLDSRFVDTRSFLRARSEPGFEFIAKHRRVHVLFFAA